jgi:hypothetical protein
VLLRIFLVITSGLLLGGCQSRDEKIAEAEKSIQSWYATLSETQSQFDNELVPPVYVDQLVDAADKSLDAQAETIDKSDPSGKTGLKDRIVFVRDRAKRLRESAKREARS